VQNKLAEDLTGKRFTKLVVIKRVKSKYDKAHWLCKCDCGNKTIVSTSGLKSGHTKSCGCYQDETASNVHFVDLTGQRFGKLVTIRRCENSKTGLVKYECKCDCGNITKVVGATLLDGRTQSCGCWKYSKLEEFVLKYFREKKYINNIDYACQKKFEGLIGTGGLPLSYDFIVYKENTPYYLIECQGKQHYEAIEYFGGEEQLKRQKQHDKLKKEYAERIGVPLLEIPYTTSKYKDVKTILQSVGI
jgi:hypothetical protein